MSDRAVLSRINLVLGGARSGKSSYAESLIDEAGLDKVYVATCESRDAEMAERIAAHKARRGGDWVTIEEPFDLADTLAARSDGDSAILVDCLTLWLSNLIGAGRDAEAESGNLLDALTRADGPVVLVSNEVGLGIVPDNKLAREFRDRQGWLNRKVAEVSELVVFMAAGLPLVLKSPEWEPIKKDMV